MAEPKQGQFGFEIEKVPTKFYVYKFTGSEGISQLYEFAIDLVSEDAAVDLESVIAQPAVLTLYRSNQPIQIKGILASFEQRGKDLEHVHYQAVLVPMVWLLTLSKQSRIFQEQNVPQIIEEVLKEHGLTSKDFDLSKLTKSDYVTKEYVVQYQESDFNFISRLMEHEGIFYYFHEGKIIIADQLQAHQPVPSLSGPDGTKQNTLLYRATKGAFGGWQESIHGLVCRHKGIPREVVLQDYNWRKPSLNLKSPLQVDQNGHGTFMEYGNHYKDTAEGTRLAKVRAQEQKCGQKMFFGDSDCQAFRPGFTFKMQEHYREDFNDPMEFLLTALHHSGQQPLVHSRDDVNQKTQESQERSYENHFECIPAKEPFRPPRTTEKPKLYGVMNAKIDATGLGEYAEVDSMGRYKVKLPFDLSDKKDGKASRYIRMAQPYAGVGMGMHFPLHKGTEVLLSFVDGDLDRPVIAGSVPNPETASPITGENPTQARVKTGGGNEILLEDRADSQYINLSSPGNESFLSLGKSHHSIPCPDGVAIGTQKGIGLNAGKGIFITAGSPTHDEGVANSGTTSNTILSTIAALAAGVATASGLAADKAAAGVVPLSTVVGELAGFTAGVLAPGVYISAPGKVACMATGEVVLGGGATLDVVSIGPANLLSATNVLVASGGSITQAAKLGDLELVAMNKDLKIHAQKKDVEIEGNQNVKVEAEKGSIEIEAKKGKDPDGRVSIVANQAMELHAREKPLLISTGEDDIAISAKKGNISLKSNKKNVQIEAEEKLVLKCGKATMTLNKNGDISINGNKISTKGSGNVIIKGKKILGN